MALTFEVDTSALEAKVADAIPALEEGLKKASVNAAFDGLGAVKARHPYTDRTHNLTDNSEVIDDPHGGAFMHWPENYANFVDKGTRRSAAYPFTPLAKKVADKALNDNTKEAVDRFADRFKR